jgi:hypothetical protein
MPTSTHAQEEEKRKRRMRMHIATNSKYILLSTTHPASHYIINYSLAGRRAAAAAIQRVSLRRILFCCYYYALLCFACAFIHYNDSSLRFLFAALRRVCVCAVLNYLRRLYVPSGFRALLCVCLFYICICAAVCSQFEYQAHTHSFNRRDK